MSSNSGPVTSTAAPQAPLKGEHALPQYGFGADVAFDKLIDSNPFLFRVHTPQKESSPFYDKTEPYFMGQLWDNQVSSGSFSRSIDSPSPYHRPPTGTYDDAVRHLDWTTRSTSPYVSTSFSFAWAIWEATRRYHHGVKHDIEIAIIDAKAVASRAVTAAELLRTADAKDRHKDHWKWYRHAIEAQDVLVWGFVPGTAVLASVPLMQIISRLPSYFLTPDVDPVKTSALSRLAWDYSSKRPSYRQFCQELSERFLRLPGDRRMRDSTVGAARLAVALLRPFFHKLAEADFASSNVTVCELAFVVARWPGLWWVREHPEVGDLIRCTVHVVAEEAREAGRVRAEEDAGQMQGFAGVLEQLTRAYEMNSRLHRYLPPTPGASTDGSTMLDEQDIELDEQDPMELVTIPSEPISPKASQPDLKQAVATARSASASASMCGITSTATISFTRIESPEDQREVEPSRPAITAPEEPEASTSTAIARSKSAAPSVLSVESFVMTASCILTGFFFGTFVTLAMLSPHRREIANTFT